MKITFSTPQGAVEDDFNPDEPLTAAKAKVLEKLRLPAAWADQYIVALDEIELDQSQSPNQLGVSDGSTLVVWRVSSTHAKRAGG